MRRILHFFHKLKNTIGRDIFKKLTANGKITLFLHGHPLTHAGRLNHTLVSPLFLDTSRKATLAIIPVCKKWNSFQLFYSCQKVPTNWFSESKFCNWVGNFPLTTAHFQQQSERTVFKFKVCFNTEVVNNSHHRAFGFSLCYTSR